MGDCRGGWISGRPAWNRQKRSFTEIALDAREL
jgi:hypothetical protein